jgi:Ni,Fe-hydrogenase I cytochrome b subunit
MQTSLSQRAMFPLVIYISKIANSLYINYIQQYIQVYLFLTSKHRVNLNNPKKEVAQFSEALVPTYHTTKLHVTENWNNHCLQHECMDQ